MCDSASKLRCTLQLGTQDTTLRSYCSRLPQATATHNKHYSLPANHSGPLPCSLRRARLGIRASSSQGLDPSSDGCSLRASGLHHRRSALLAAPRDAFVRLSEQIRDVYVLSWGSCETICKNSRNHFPFSKKYLCTVTVMTVR